jgi:hypothetical protein
MYLKKSSRQFDDAFEPKESDPMQAAIMNMKQKQILQMKAKIQ